MRQRLGLAQALLGAPGLLLLDEPTSGLDPGFQRDLFALLRDATRAGAAVLLSSHTLTEVEAQRLKRIAIMKNGRLAACGTLDELRAGAALPAQARVTVAPGTAAAVAARLGNGRAADGGRPHGRHRLPARRDDRSLAPHRRAGRRRAGRGNPSAAARRALRALPGGRHAAMNALLAIAGREIRDGFRNRWILAATLLLGALALILALLGSAPTGAVGENRLAVTVVSLSSLGVFLIPLIALLLSYETFVVEVERGTMLLLLACPVARWQVVFGKFLGHVAILALSIAVGYGAAGLAAGVRREAPTGRRGAPSAP